MEGVERRGRIIEGYNNKGIDKILKEIRSKIEEGRELGEVIVVCGDLNARIGELQAGDDEERFSRRSRDKDIRKVKGEGRKLIL